MSFDSIIGVILFGIIILVFTFAFDKYDYTKEKKYKIICIISIILGVIVTVLDGLGLFSFCSF